MCVQNVKKCLFYYTGHRSDPTTISQNLKWDNHIVKKSQQWLYFLRQLRKFNLPQELLKQFYSAIIEYVLCTSITFWFSSATKSDLRRLQRVVRTAERVIGATLPTLQKPYSSRVSKRAGKIILDPSHTPHTLAVWSALQSSKHQNSQTWEKLLPSRHLPHEQLNAPSPKLYSNPCTIGI